MGHLGEDEEDMVDVVDEEGRVDVGGGVDKEGGVDKKEKVDEGEVGSLSKQWGFDTSNGMIGVIGAIYFTQPKDPFIQPTQYNTLHPSLTYFIQ